MHIKAQSLLIYFFFRLLSFIPETLFIPQSNEPEFKGTQSRTDEDKQEQRLRRRHARLTIRPSGVTAAENKSGREEVCRSHGQQYTWSSAKLDVMLFCFVFSRV